MVHPGEVVVGVLNGIVVVPRESGGEILSRLRKRRAVESDYQAAVVRGEFSNAWVHGVLKSAHVEFDNR